MREIVFATAAAAAACLAAAAPAMAQSDWDWTGFYAGASVGGVTGDTSTRTSGNPGGGAVVIPPADLAAINAAGGDSDNKTGFTGGIEAGVNYMFGSLVVGLETDYSAFDINQSKTTTFNSGLLIAPPVVNTLTQQLTTDWLWTLRPRLGYASGQWLFYGTAGAAASKITYDVAFSNTRTPADIGSQSFSDTKVGWTAGLGAAFAPSPAWSVKGEYLYTDLGNIRGSLSTPTGFVAVTSQAQVKASAFKVGLDYRF